MPAASNRSLVRVAPWLLFGGAAVALLLPVALRPWLPAGDPGEGFAEVRSQVLAGRLTAGALAAFGFGLLVRRCLHVPIEGGRDALRLALSAGVVVLLAAPPTYDAVIGEATTARYTQAGTLEPAEGARLEGVTDAGDLGALFRAPTTRGPVDGAGDVHLGPYPATKGDSWLVMVVLNGPDPRLLTNPLMEATGATCEPGTIMDYRGSVDPAVGTAWKCTATRNGDASFLVHGGQGAKGYEASAVVLASYSAGALASLDASFLLMGGTTAVGALVCTRLARNRLRAGAADPDADAA